MLEYALFDLSGFVQPTVVPTVNVTFNPSPLTVKSGDTADQLTVNVTQRHESQTDSSAVLSFTMPAGLTITAMSDPTGGWICTVAHVVVLAHFRSLAASTTDSVMLTISVATYTTLSSYSGTITATVSSAIFLHQPVVHENVIFQQVPPITWATPANIVYGTPLSGAQLDASSTVAGTFTYSPVAGTVLGTGPQILNATFTPTDMVTYTTAKASVTLTVIPGTPVDHAHFLGQSGLHDQRGVVHRQPSLLRVHRDRHHDFYVRIDCDRHGSGVGRLGHAHHHRTRRRHAGDHRGLLRRRRLWAGHQQPGR